jgi:hypothetical protein
LTGLFAPLIAYWWIARKPYARTAAIAWNLLGMADLTNAVVLGVLTGGGTVRPTSALRPERRFRTRAANAKFRPLAGLKDRPYERAVSARKRSLTGAAGSSQMPR